MKRIWLKVPGYRVLNIAPIKPGAASFDVRLGDALVVRGIVLRWKEEKDGPSFWQDWTSANMRFHDVPFAHRHQHIHRKHALLPDILACQLVGSYFKIYGIVEKETGQTELEFVKPMEWRGKSLRIPVDFIELVGFMKSDARGIVSSNINLGHHITVWETAIYNGSNFCLDGKGTSVMQDPALQAAISDLLRRPSVRTAISAIVKNGGAAREQRFSLGVKGYDTNGNIPAVRFY